MATIEKNQNQFTFFFQTQSPFSQWHPSLFTVKDITFISGEQFMMYCKAKLFNDGDVSEALLNINKTNASAIELINTKTNIKILASSAKLKEWNKAQKNIKALGRSIENFSEAEWVKHRVNYVYRGNLEKFKQNPILKEALINTGDTIIAEASPFDKIWGIGMSKDTAGANNPDNWKGLNLLGGILSRIRSDLQP